MDGALDLDIRKMLVCLYVKRIRSSILVHELFPIEIKILISVSKNRISEFIL